MEIQGNELRIICPPGMEIDQENSTFECIKFRPIVKRWRDQNNVVSGYILNGDVVCPYEKDWNDLYGKHDVFATEKQAKSAFAMAQISQIMANDERFGGVVTDEEWKLSTTTKYTIERDNGEIRKGFYTTTYNFLAFHTYEQCDLFIAENEDLIKAYLMID